jgi:hypothetical protein
VVDAQRLIGSVELLIDDGHSAGQNAGEGARVLCDSAWRFADDRFILMGSVAVHDDGSLLRCSEFELISADARGRAKGTAEAPATLLDDQGRILTAPLITHDFASDISRFDGGGTVTTQGERITSEAGSYYSGPGVFGFQGDVIAAMDSIEMRSEAMRYSPADRSISWSTPARIDRPSGWVESPRGLLDLEAGTGWFAGSARVMDDGLLILGDSLVFADSLGASIGAAFGSAHILDTAAGTRLWGDIARWDAAGLALTGRARSELSGDSTKAADIQTQSEYLYWSERDSIVRLEGAPVLWSGSDELSGDSIRVRMAGGQPQSLRVRGAALFRSEIDSTHHNEVAGRTLDGAFVDGKLSQVLVAGNARTLHLTPPDSTSTARPDSAAVDSIPLAWQANAASCRHLAMNFEDGELDRMVLYDRPEGELTSPSDSPVTYNAVDSIVMWAATQEVALHGAAIVRTDGITLEAADITYAAATREVCAAGRPDSTGGFQGSPVFSEGGKTFEQQTLCYSLESGKGLSTHSISHENELHFHAERSKRLPDGRIFIKGGMLTTCDADKPHFHFHLTRALVIPDDRIVSGPMYVKLRGVPLPVGLPFFWFPQKQEESAGILFPSFGNGRALGYFIKDLGWYQPLGPHWDARLQGDVYSRGSWAVRAATAYNFKYQFSGKLSLSRSIILQGLNGDPDRSRSREFFVRWNHAQDARARPNGRFSANVNFGTSGNFRNTLSTTQEDFVSNSFSSSVQYNASIPGKPVNVSASARHTQNSSTGTVSLVLPALGINVSRFELPVSKIFRPDAVGKKWYDRIGVTYATQAEQRISSPDSTLFDGGLQGMLSRASSGVRHTASASTQWQLGYVSITPSANYKGYWNFAALDRQAVVLGPDSVELVTDTLGGFYADGDFNLSINASTRFYGMFNFAGGSGSTGRSSARRLQALRHVISPSVGFSYNPAYERSLDVIHEEDVLDTYNPYSLGVYTPGDISARGALTLGLGNNLEMKIRERPGEDGAPGELKKVRLIDNFQLNTSHNFQADSLRWADIRGNGFSTIAGRYRVNFGTVHSLYDRNNDGQAIDAFLVESGSGLARLKSANASLNASWSGKQGATPWSASAGYTLNLTRRWDTATLADTSDVTQGIRFDGAVTLMEKWKLRVNSGYDFNAMDWAPTQINLYWDLHCWEFSANWIPSGVMQSVQIRLAIKASMLRDVKLEKRFAGEDLFR